MHRRAPEDESRYEQQADERPNGCGKAWARLSRRNIQAFRTWSPFQSAWSALYGRGTGALVSHPRWSIKLSNDIRAK